jgi:adhesin/invasin
VSTGADGTASVNFTASGSSGTILIQASSLQGSAVFTITVNDLAGHTLSYVNEGASNGQSAFLNTTLTNSLSVLLKDSNNQPKAGTIVRFQCQSINCGAFSNGLTYLDVSTDVNGIASASYTLGTTAGIYGVRALIPSQSAIYKEFSATAAVDPNSVVNLANSTLTLSNGTVTADGLATVTATLVIKDSYGNTIPNSSKTVSVVPAPTNLGAWGGAGFVGNNGVYTRIYSVGNTAGEITFTGAVNGQSLTSTAPTLTLAPDTTPFLNNTTITALNGTLTADGSSKTTVVVTLYDMFGNQITAGSHTAVITTNTGTLGAVSFHSGTGTYRATFTSPNSIGSGSSTITLSSVNGNAVAGKTTSITLQSGTISTAKSTFSFPNRITTATSSGQVLTITLRDTNDNPVITSGTVQVVKTNLQGTQTGSLSNAGVATHQGSGVYTVTYTSPAVSTGCTLVAPCIDNVTASITVGGVTTQIGNTLKINNAFSTYTGGIVPSTASIYSLSSSTGAAGIGASTIIATVTLRNASSQAFVVGGHSALLTASTAFSSGGISIVDNDNGTYSITIASPATSASGNLNIQYNGSHITSSPTIVSFIGAPVAANSSLSLSSSTLNGAGTITATVVLRDVNNVVIPNCSMYANSIVRFTQNGNGAWDTVIPANTATGCNVVSGQARYTQTFTRTTTPTIDFESVTIGAQINPAGTWDSLSSTNLTITPANLAGITIDCTNLASYRDTFLYVNGGTLTINSWTDGSAVSCAGNSFRFLKVRVGPSGIITHQTSTSSNAHGLSIVVTGDINIELGGSINANSKGLLGGNQSGNPSTSQGYRYPMVLGTSVSPSHASIGTGGLAADIVGTPANPNWPGGGGNTNNTPCGAGRNGGGLIHISAANIINEGSIQASGGSFSTAACGGGSAIGVGAGGSIKLTVSGSLTGAGTIEAKAGQASGVGYAAGGGRIAIYGDASAVPLNKFSVAEGTTMLAGTLYFSDTISTVGTFPHNLTINGTSNASTVPFDVDVDVTVPTGVTFNHGVPISVKSLTVNGTLTSSTSNTATITVADDFIINANSHTFYAPVSVEGNFTLATGASITHPTVTASNALTKPRVDISAGGDITIQAGANINVSGKGFPGALTGGGLSLTTDAGRGAPTTGDGIFSVPKMISGAGSGGNHLSVGGINGTGITWGSTTEPFTYGGGGVGGTNTLLSGGNGGGIIRLIANRIYLDGTLTATGGTPGTPGDVNGAGGGAGGSIYVQATTISSPLNTGAATVAGSASRYGGAGGLITYKGTISGTFTNTLSGGTGTTTSGGNGTLTLIP